MSKETFALATYGKGQYQFKVVEKAICLRVARRAVKAAGYSAAFAQATGRSFSGTGADRELLPPTVARRVDAALCKSMRRFQKKWEASPIGNVALDRPEAYNLILNQGLDYLGSGMANWGTIGTYCVLGSGTTTPSYADTGLDSEIVRTSNTLGTGSFTSGDVSTRTLTIQRTYDFPAETSGKNYAELGLSHSGTVTNNLSTRALIDGGTVSVATGQQARVVYKILITLGANAVMTPASSTGWTAGLQGTSAYCTFGGQPSIGVSGVDGQANLALCTGSTIPAFGTPFTPGTTSGGSGSLDAYTTGTYKRTRTTIWSLTQGVGTWRSLIINTGTAGTAYAWCWVFDNDQTKDNLHTLTIIWSMTYGRA